MTSSPVPSTTFLKVVVGPMFAGKSSALLWELEREAIIRSADVLYICHASDTRAHLISSHSELTRATALPANIAFLKTSRLSSLEFPDDRVFAAIGIDEAQFFEATDLVMAVEKWIQSGKYASIYVFGLDGTFQQQPFPNSGIHLLLPLANEFSKSTSAICIKCLEESSGEFRRTASFTARKYAPLPGESLIGGAEMYEAVCRKHLPAGPK